MCRALSSVRVKSETNLQFVHDLVLDKSTRMVYDVIVLKTKRLQASRSKNARCVQNVPIANVASVRVSCRNQDSSAKGKACRFRYADSFVALVLKMKQKESEVVKCLLQECVRITAMKRAGSPIVSVGNCDFPTVCRAVILYMAFAHTPPHI